MARALRGDRVGGFRQGVWIIYRTPAAYQRGGGGLAQAQTTAPPAEMSEEAKQRNMTQEVRAMPEHVSQDMFEKKWSRPIFGPSHTVTICGLELSPQLALPGATVQHPPLGPYMGGGHSKSLRS